MVKKSLQESVITALDGSDPALFPFMPYILQDLWEMGADPATIIHLVNKHVRHVDFTVLDLGCGKGAVSIQLAKKFQCRCIGIDAVKEFIDEAWLKAREWGVEDQCRFDTGDIREMVGMFTGFDVVILGSIGPVFGNYFETLSAVVGCLNVDGVIILDDGYLEDERHCQHAVVEKKSVLLRQIHEAGMSLIDEKLMDADHIRRSNEIIFAHIRQRCYELEQRHPDQKDIFMKYVHDQEEENTVLENDIVCSTMVIRKRDQ